MKKLILLLALLAASSSCFAMRGKRVATALHKIYKQLKTHNRLKKIELTIQSAQLELKRLSYFGRSTFQLDDTDNIIEKQRADIQNLLDDDKKE